MKNRIFFIILAIAINTSIFPSITSKKNILGNLNELQKKCNSIYVKKYIDNSCKDSYFRVFYKLYYSIKIFIKNTQEDYNNKNFIQLLQNSAKEKSAKDIIAIIKNNLVNNDPEQYNTNHIRDILNFLGKKGRPLNLDNETLDTLFCSKTFTIQIKKKEPEIPPVQEIFKEETEIVKGRDDEKKNEATKIEKEKPKESLVQKTLALAANAVLYPITPSEQPGMMTRIRAAMPEPEELGLGAGSPDDYKEKKKNPTPIEKAVEIVQPSYVPTLITNALETVSNILKNVPEPYDFGMGPGSPDDFKDEAPSLNIIKVAPSEEKNKTSLKTKSSPTITEENKNSEVEVKKGLETLESPKIEKQNIKNPSTPIIIIESKAPLDIKPSTEITDNNATNISKKDTSISNLITPKNEEEDKNIEIQTKQSKSTQGGWFSWVKKAWDAIPTIEETGL